MDALTFFIIGLFLQFSIVFNGFIYGIIIYFYVFIVFIYGQFCLTFTIIYYFNKMSHSRCTTAVVEQKTVGYLFLIFNEFPYSSQFPTVLGNGTTSLIFPIPVRYITHLSKPRPKPACLAVPYLRRSR